MSSIGSTPASPTHVQPSHDKPGGTSHGGPETLKHKPPAKPRLHGMPDSEAPKSSGQQLSLLQRGRRAFSPAHIMGKKPELTGIAPPGAEVYDLGSDVERQSLSEDESIDHQMAFLSEKTREAYAAWKTAEAECQKVADDPNATDKAKEEAADKLLTALHEWVTEATADIRYQTSGPGRLTMPTLSKAAANTVAMALNNMLTFTLSTAVSVLLEGHMSKTSAEMVNSGLITFMQAFGADAAPFAGRMLGGAEAQLRVSVGDHSNNGQYTKMATNLAMTVLAVIFHGSLHVSMSAGNNFFNDTPGGQITRAAVSGIGMSVLTQAVTYGGAKATEAKTGVTHAKYLPEDQHNRTNPNGIYMQDYAPMSERTTNTHKAKEVLLRTISAIAGGALHFGLTHVINDAFKPEGDDSNSGHPVAHSLSTILGTYTAMFVVMSAIQMLGNLAFFDPKRHIARFGKTSNELVIGQIRDSAAVGTRNLLNRAGVAMERGQMGAEIQRQLLESAQALSGQAFRDALNPSRPDSNGEPIDHLIDHLRDKAMEISAMTVGPSALLSDGTVQEIARNLIAASDSLEIAFINYIETGNGMLNPEVNDANNRLRDISGLLLQGITQMGGGQHADMDPRIAKIAQDLMPTLAAVNKVDRMATARGFADAVALMDREHSRADQRTGLKKLAHALSDDPGLAALNKMSAMLANRGVIDEAVALMHRTGEDTASVNNTLNRVLKSNFGETPAQMPSVAGLVKDQRAVGILMFQNKLLSNAKPTATQRAEQEARLQTHLDTFAQIDHIVTRMQDAVARANRTEAPGPQAEASALRERFEQMAGPAVKQFVLDFQAGRFTMDQLNASVLSKLDDPAPDDAATRGDALNQFKQLLGDTFVKALRDEQAPAVEAGDVGQQLVEELWTDMQRAPAQRQEALSAAMSLPVLAEIPGVPMHYQKDVHAHLTNYNGVITAMARQAMENRANRVELQLNAAIPHQVPNSTAEKKYYTAIERLMDYVNRDYALAANWMQMSEPKRMRVLELTMRYSNDPAKNIEPTSTGGDPTDVNSQRRELAHIERAFRDCGIPIRVVGETTFAKEQVQKLTPRAIRVANESSVATVNESFNAGKVFLMHADGGSSHLDKRSHTASLDQLVRDVETTMSHPSTDPIRSQPGLEDEADRYALLIHAHGPGLGKTISDRNDHVRHIDERLEQANKLLGDKGELNVDLSWDFVAHYICENMYDVLKQEGVAPEVQQGLQNVLKSYRSFDAVGAPSDKADDIGSLDQTGSWRIGSNAVAGLHFQSLAAYRGVVERAMKDPEVRKTFMKLAENHTDRGNNWLHLLNKHQDRFMYGSDCLAPGIKAHGQNAYALNTRMLEPMYVIFDELGKYDKKYAGVTDKIARGNLQRVLDNDKMEARRDSYAKYTAEGASEWGSGPIRPDQRARPAPIPEGPGAHPSVPGMDNNPPDQLRRRRTAVGKQDTGGSYDFSDPLKKSTGFSSSFAKGTPKGSGLAFSSKPLAPRPEQANERLDRIESLRKAGIDAMNTAKAVDIVAEHQLGGSDPEQPAALSGTPKPTRGVITATPKQISPEAEREYKKAIDKHMPAAKAWLAEQGAKVIPNRGTGLNCLIISLLQHATAGYTDDLQTKLKIEETAEALRKELNLGTGMLYSDDPKFDALVSRVNTLYPDAKLNVTVAVPTEDSKTFATYNHNPDGNSTNSVLILQGSNHYEAVTMATPAR